MVHPLPGDCPVCGGEMEIHRVYCPSCDVSIEGRFIPGRLARLSPEQIHFVETFIRCEGTLKRVEEELGISYPTVRSRLRDVIRSMGFEVDEPASPTVDDEQRRTILDQLDNGEISTQEALDLLGRN